MTRFSRFLPLCGTVLLCAGAQAQTAPAPVNAPAFNRTLVVQAPGAVGQTANQAASQVGQTANQTLGGAGQTVQGLQPTLQPVAQGVGGALGNLTSPDTLTALLQFLGSVVPNHIEAHVNLDALRVEKLTVDVRGVDLRNLRVDLLVANSRSANGGAGGTPQSALNRGGNTQNNGVTSLQGASGSAPAPAPTQR